MLRVCIGLTVSGERAEKLCCAERLSKVLHGMIMVNTFAPEEAQTDQKDVYLNG